MITVGRRAFLAAIALVAPFRVSLRAQSFSVDDFLALSSRLTGYENLDRQTAGIFLKNLLATPGNSARLARPDAALETDIIAAWYTGVQQVRGEAQLVTHTGALQWRALGMPAPGTCVGPFGSWAKPHRSPLR
jgi:D-sorbitol dehydrogenase-like protein